MIKVWSGNTEFHTFENIECSASLDNLARSFSFTLHPVEGWREKLNVGDISIYVDDRLFLTGSIDTISTSINTSHMVSISGRSNLTDVLDSSYTGDTSEFTDVHVRRLIDYVLSDFKISINYEGEINYVFPSIKFSSGQDIHSILNRIASEAQIFYNELPDGTLRVFSEMDKSVFSMGEASILSRTYNLDKSRLNSEIIIRGQSSNDGLDEMQIEEIALNKAVKTYRPLVITNNYVTSSSAKSLAQWVMAGQVSKAVQFSYSMTLNAQVPLGNIVKIDDVVLGISGQFVVNSVAHKQDAKSGSITTVELLMLEAFGFEPVIRELKLNKSKKQKQYKKVFIESIHAGEEGTGEYIDVLI